MSGPVVLFREIPCRDGSVLGVATLNSERSLHSLNVPIITTLYPQLLAWARDGRVRAVFLEGAGERAFCAGGDVKSICLAVRQNGIDDNLAFRLFSNEYRLDYLIHVYPKPLVVWGTGIVMGGGIGLLCGASHRVVTETSRLAMPEITIGLYPDVGGSWFLGRRGAIGLFLGMTGANFGAADALETGFGTVAVASAHRQDVLAALADLEWPTDRAAQDARVSGVLDSYRLSDLPDGHLPGARAEIESRCGAPDFPELYCRLTEPSSHPWIDKAAYTLAAGSPTSAALIHRQWLNGANQSLPETFRQELVLSVQCARHPDFIEGVRALLVDKDQQPVWQPASVDGLTPAWLDGHYREPWSGPHPLADMEHILD